MLPFFNEIKIKNLDNKTIELFTTRLLEEGKIENPLFPKTVKDILILLKEIIKYIEIDRNINLNIQIIYPKIFKKESHVLTKEQFINLNQILLDNIDNCKLGMLAAMTTGIRIGKLCALKWKNIFLSENYIFIEKTIQRIKNLNCESPKTIIIEKSPKSSTSYRKIPIPENLLTG